MPKVQLLLLMPQLCRLPGSVMEVEIEGGEQRLPATPVTYRQGSLTS
jgi:hypothetical protein